MSDHDNSHDQVPEENPSANPGPDIPDVDFEFAEPQLGPAEISPDVAESVNLDEVEAEAARVAREAESSAELPASEVVPPIPDSRLDFRHQDGQAAGESSEVDESTVLRTDFTKAPVANNPWTAPAQPTAPPASSQLSNADDAGQPPAASGAPVAEVSAADEPAAEAPVAEVPAQNEADKETLIRPIPPAVAPGAPAAPATAPHIGRGIDDGSGWRRPETPWQQSATPWQPKANSWQSPGQVAQGAADAAAAAAASASANGESQAPGQPPAGAPSQPPYGQQPWPPHGQQPPAQQPYGQQPQGQQQPSAPSGSHAPYGAPMQHGTPNAGGPNYAAPNYGASGQQASGQQAGFPPVPPVPGQPGQPGAPWQGVPGQQPGGTQGFPGGPGGTGSPDGRKKLFIILGAVLVAVVLVVLLVWMVFSLLLGSTKAGDITPQPVQTSAAADNSNADASPSAASSDGDVIVAQASSLDWLDGDCLRGFNGIEKSADVVLCSSPHSAQVVASYEYPMADSFPGDDTVKAKATEVCKNAPVTTAAKNYKGLKSYSAYPTSGSWDGGDRRVQCIAVDPTGDNIKTTLVN